MQLGHLEHVDADPAGRADHHDALARLDAGPRPADVDRGTDGVRDGGGGYVVDAVRQGEQGVLRQLDEFGVAAVDVAPDVAAEVITERVAPTAAPLAAVAGQVEVGQHALARLELAGARAVLGHFAGDLVAGDPFAHGTGRAAQLPGAGVDHGQPDAAGLDSDEHLARARLGRRHFGQVEGDVRFIENEGFHPIQPPIFSPASWAPVRMATSWLAPSMWVTVTASR